MNVATPIVREQGIEAQLLLLEQLPVAISAVVHLIEHDFRRLLAGEVGGDPEAE